MPYRQGNVKEKQELGVQRAMHDLQKGRRVRHATKAQIQEAKRRLKWI